MFKNTEKFNKKNKERYDDSIIKHLISNQISCQIKNCKYILTNFLAQKHDELRTMFNKQGKTQIL